MTRTSSHVPLLLAALASAGVVASAALPGHDRAAYVTVVDGDRPVRGLTADDFELFVDGQRTPFALEAPPEPASVLVLAENTQHLREVYGRYIPLGLETLQRAAPMTSDYMLATFGQRVAVEIPFTDDVSGFERAYQHAMPTFAEPALWDAVHDAIGLLEPRPGRHALIVLTSGEDASSRHTLEDVDARLRESNVVLYIGGVGVGDRLSPPVAEWPLWHGVAADPAPALRSLAESTGGGAWFALGQFSMGGAIGSMLEWFDSQYRLSFTPDVRLDGRAYDVRVRAFRTDAAGVRRSLRVNVRRTWPFPSSS
jgi:Ca-activated chloride channel family protein